MRDVRDEFKNYELEYPLKLEPFSKLNHVSSFEHKVWQGWVQGHKEALAKPRIHCQHCLQKRRPLQARGHAPATQTDLHGGFVQALSWTASAVHTRCLQQVMIDFLDCFSPIKI